MLSPVFSINFLIVHTSSLDPLTIVHILPLALTFPRGETVPRRQRLDGHAVSLSHLSTLSAEYIGTVSVLRKG